DAGRRLIAPFADVGPGGVDAERGQGPVGSHGDVGGWEAQGAPELLAGDHGPAQREAAPQQVRDLVEVALRQRVADGGRAHSAAFDVQWRRHEDDLEAELVAQGLYPLRRRLTTAAEDVVGAHD